MSLSARRRAPSFEAYENRIAPKVQRGVVVLLVLAVAVLWFLPVWAAVMASMKDSADFAQSNPLALPRSWHLDNFLMFFGPVDILGKIRNSLFISGGAVLLSLTLAFPLAYSLAIGRHKLRRVVITVCVLIFLMPLEAIAFPTYLLAKMLGMYGNPGFVLVPLGIIGTAFATFLLTNVMSHVPRELVDAAHVDGASRWQTMTRVALPLMTPTLLTVGLLLFVMNWNEYLITLLLLPDTETQTVPLAISAVNYGQFGGAPPQLLAAAGVLGALPSLLIFFVFQGTLVRGITAGAVQG